MAEPRKKEIIRELVTDLEGLPEDRLEEVRDFVEFLRHRTSGPRRGSPAALLRCFGTWEGPSGELNRLVEEIYEARHQEEE